MSDYYVLTAEPGHVGVDYTDAMKTRLGELRDEAAAAGHGKSLPYEPEAVFLIDVMRELAVDLPPVMAKAGWPAPMAAGEKLNDFMVLTLKEVAREARGRGTNASAKLALAGIPEA